MKNLNLILKKLKSIKSIKNDYSFPKAWLPNTENYNGETININPVKFYSNQIEWIKNNRINEKNIQNSNPIIYNMFIRFTTAFDHNQDNKIYNEINNFKETGSFLKSIAFLPYLKKLGINVIYLLPVTSIGKQNNKGNLGSPYSVFNHYKLDENLNEDILDIDIETQFKAFIEAAHLLGFKIIAEFIFRTASIDTDLALEHPEWFYWLNYPDETELNIKEKSTPAFSAPKFTEETLTIINQKIKNNDFDNLPAPSKEYIELFSETPKAVKRDNSGKIIGIINNKKVKLASAFADWPPDDHQPEWSDVTYLKLYNHKDFNYIAYNTIRMYDNILSSKKNEQKELWKYIENIIPYYQKEFKIDGVMIDMGHAIPKKLMLEIIKKARKKDKDFIFWEENFIPEQKSLETGYNCVLGYIPFDAHNCRKMQDLIRNLEQKKYPIKLLAASETHNTPRSAGRSNNPIEFNKLMYTVNAMLPLPLFLLSGFELCETNPINTGLGFDETDTNKFTVEKLPLFSISSLKWNDSNNIINYIRSINNIREEYLSNNDELPIYIWNNSTEHVLIFQRLLDNNKSLLIIGNYNNQEETIDIIIPENALDIISGEKINSPITLQAYEAKILLLS